MACIYLTGYNAEMFSSGKFFKTYVIPAALAAVLIAATFMLGIYIGAREAPEAITAVNGGAQNEDLKQFFEVWKELDGKFVGEQKPTEEEKIWGAIEGLTASYKDPYTVFFPPVESKAFEDEVSGAFEGVGMEVGIRNDILVVVSPLKDTPAYRAGVLAGDKILKIDNKDTAGLSVDRAVKLIRGKGGTTVTLTLAREGKSEPFEVPIVRATINIPTVNTELRKDGVFVLHLYNFSAQSFTKFREVLREFVESGTDKLILDLRNNPGGYLEAAVDMAGWFLPAGEMVVREDYGGKKEEIVHRSRGYNIFNDKLKLIILVNGGSASASEILAGALRDYGKARIVGEKTFGKGSVQELVKISGDSSLKVTVARWLTPKGVSISKEGIVPDIVVKMTQEDFEKKGDIQLEEAASILSKESATSSTAWILNAPQIIIGN